MIDLKPFRAAKDDVKQWCEKLSKWLEDSYWLEKLDQGKLVPKGEKFVNDGDVMIDGDLHVTGDTDLDGTLNVDGAADFNAGADVVGAVQVTGNVGVTGSVTVSGSIGMPVTSSVAVFNAEIADAAKIGMRFVNSTATAYAQDLSAISDYSAINAKNANNTNGNFSFWTSTNASGTYDGMLVFVHKTQGSLSVCEGEVAIFVAGSGTLREAVKIASDKTLITRGGAVFNEDSQSVDVRIESDGDAYNFVSSGSLNRVGIGTNSPNAKLDVRGGVIINEDASDVDTRIEGAADPNLVFVDAGNNNVAFGTATTTVCAKVEISSTTGGLLLPRMTTAQRDAITSTAAGLVLYNTTVGKMQVYTTIWETVTSV